MYDKGVNAFLSALNFFLDWLALSKMLDIINNVVFPNDDIDLDYINSDVVTFFSDNIDITTIDLENISLNDDDDDPKSMIHFRPVAWCN